MRSASHLNFEAFEVINLIHTMWTNNLLFVLHRQNKSTDLSKDLN